MKLSIGVSTALLLLVAGIIATALPGQERWSVWVLVACATALPAISAAAAWQKAGRIGGREGVAWRTMSAGMALMAPIYLANFLGWGVTEDILIYGAYLVGGIAIMLIPLPNAGPYQRLVASLDAAGIGVVVATATFWFVSGLQIDGAGHAIFAMIDAAIMSMIGYVGLRRSQRKGIDWSFFWIIAAVGSYLAGILVTSGTNAEYYLGHPADITYMIGMAFFALATLIKERRHEPSRQILKPVRWGHVLAPYILVSALAIVLIPDLISRWSANPAGSALETGILATMLLVLVRQLAMILEQRRKIELEQNGVIATVSHELRTPLTTVVGFLDLLEEWDDFSDEEKIEMVRLMRNQSHVMGRVVGDLVAVAREEIEQLQIARSIVSVDALIQEAIEMVPELSDSELRVSIGESTDLTADRERMLQIMTNFLSNATKYGAGQIEVVVFEDADSTAIEVHDDGPGIPEVFRVVIWERFERGPQRQGTIPGSGIGLSVARGIARSHGGDTTYQRSNRLGGACFAVRIPIHRSLLRQTPNRQVQAVEDLG